MRRRRPPRVPSLSVRHIGIYLSFSRNPQTAKPTPIKGEKLKIVLVSGRSASGKTTFTRKVCEKLSEKGREARHIALDDFLLGLGYMPVNDDGTFDMESIAGLDTALANECFRLLLREGRADFPTFDFPEQRRGEKWNRIEEFIS